MSVNVDVNRINDDVRFEQCGGESEGGVCLLFTPAIARILIGHSFISHHLKSHSTKAGLNAR